MVPPLRSLFLYGLSVQLFLYWYASCLLNFHNNSQQQEERNHLKTYRDHSFATSIFPIIKRDHVIHFSYHFFCCYLLSKSVFQKALYLQSVFIQRSFFEDSSTIFKGIAYCKSLGGHLLRLHANFGCSIFGCSSEVVYRPPRGVISCSYITCFNTFWLIVLSDSPWSKP